MKLASSLSMKRMAFAISSGSPARFIDVVCAKPAIFSFIFGARLVLTRPLGTELAVAADIVWLYGAVLQKTHGAIALTRILGPTSLDTHFVSPMTPHLLTQYGEAPAAPDWPPVLAALTIDPGPLIAFSCARTQFFTPSRLVFIIVSQSSSSRLASGN